MDKAEELNKASHVVLDAEVRLNAVSLQIQELDREIALLNSVEKHLIENINVLQRKRAIVVVTEYKKARMDLNTARARLAFLRIDRQNCGRILEQCEIAYIKAKASYEEAFDNLHDPPNNVIQGAFGKKDG